MCFSKQTKLIFKVFLIHKLFAYKSMKGQKRMSLLLSCHDHMLIRQLVIVGETQLNLQLNLHLPNMWKVIWVNKGHTRSSCVRITKRIRIFSDSTTNLSKTLHQPCQKLSETFKESVKKIFEITALWATIHKFYSSQCLFGQSILSNEWYAVHVV